MHTCLVCIVRHSLLLVPQLSGGERSMAAARLHLPSADMGSDLRAQAADASALIDARNADSKPPDA